MVGLYINNYIDCCNCYLLITWSMITVHRFAEENSRDVCCIKQVIPKRRLKAIPHNLKCHISCQTPWRSLNWHVRLSERWRKQPNRQGPEQIHILPLAYPEWPCGNSRMIIEGACFLNWRLNGNWRKDVEPGIDIRPDFWRNLRRHIFNFASNTVKVTRG